jgi:hypothetical protein
MWGSRLPAERLAPDTVASLERASVSRYKTAEILRLQSGHSLAAIYFYGFSAEMSLSAAYFRSAGFNRLTHIGRDLRNRRMAQARQLRDVEGRPLMNSDPHPIVGWARCLAWQRAIPGELEPPDSQRLTEVIRKSHTVYAYWRPELRYKTRNFPSEALDEVRGAVRWIIENQSRF